MKNSPSLPPAISAILNANTTHDLSPKTIAEIVQFCIKHETKPGGPYAFNTTVPDELIVKKLNHLFALAQPAPANSSTSIGKRNSISGEVQLLQAKAYRQLYDGSVPSLSTLARDLYYKTLQRVKGADTIGEISLLTYYFRKSVHGGTKIADRNSDDDDLYIAQANILIWTAYTIIDSLLDSQSHRLHISLEVILWCTRRAAELYSRAGVSYKLRDSLFSAVDQANTNELEMRSVITITSGSSRSDWTITLVSAPHAHTLKQLMARKSIAHTIGPRCIIATRSQSVQNEAIAAFELYCSARQLLDDMHDWQNDLRSGHLTYVIAKLFKHSGTVIGSYPGEVLIQKLKQSFWDSVLEECCKEIIDMTGRSRVLLESNLLKTNSSFVALTVHPIQQAAESALFKHTVEKELLKSLKGKSPS
ncbi:MAG: hypothetical protein ACO1N2_02195 [Candidatus Saccharimonadota bacterium]